jgi:succinate-semialdehyde dehydrogenase/glutarate-semialdehyde dehydrogenase
MTAAHDSSREAAVLTEVPTGLLGVEHSGFGREGGSKGIEEYLETKYVGVAP